MLMKEFGSLYFIVSHSFNIKFIIDKPKLYIFVLVNKLITLTPQLKCTIASKINVTPKGVRKTAVNYSTL